MDADRVADVFAEACALAPGEQAAFLDRACAGDAELRAEVDSLLGCRDTAAAFLEKPIFEAGAELLAEAESQSNGELKAGDTLGEYSVLSLIGVGGMGEVYLAHDTKLERRVAIKLIQRVQGGSALARYFRHERRVLAALNHPHIARLYDSGVTPDGRAYLVMEYVEGERLDTYCVSRQLPLAERLALFRKICAGVAYAHQCLVVHRDLKPANIRVTPEGEPKLLDFGIAKLLESDADTEPDGEPTLTMQAMMTPEYASPEQMRGGPITTASDVYSLGVVLYEMLTGERPYQLKNHGLDEAARIVCEEEPERPSDRLRRQKVEGRRLKAEGELDNIVAMAMRKEPARRYVSVSQFSEDIRRLGEGLPVLARRDTAGYRARKFLQRNKIGVAAAALVGLALVGGLAGTTWQARRAQRRFDDLRRLANSVLYEIEPQIASLPGAEKSRAMLIKHTVDYLDRLSGKADGNLELSRELANAYSKVGDVQGNPDANSVGDFAGAKASYGKALALRESLLTADAHDATARKEDADALAVLHRKLAR